MYVELLLNKRKNAYGEYKIKCYTDGHEYEEGTYYTEDWEDALGTLKAIAEHNNTIVIKNVKLNFRTGKATLINYQVVYTSNIDVGDQ